MATATRPQAIETAGSVQRERLLAEIGDIDGRRTVHACQFVDDSELALIV